MSSTSSDNDENGCSSISDNDESGCSSMMSTSELRGPSSTNSRKKRKSMSGSVFKAWSFQLQTKADLGHGTAADEKARLLTEHFRTRTRHTLPSSVTGGAVFFDGLLFSAPPDSAGLVSIELQGYVQARYSIPLSTVKKWIDSASWKPVPGGLTGDDEYMSNMRRFEDPDDQWTRLMLFGSIGANNAGRAAEKATRKVEFSLEILAA
jgi:hypothetical protein